MSAISSDSMALTPAIRIFYVNVSPILLITHNIHIKLNYDIP